jgi:hypothetical protein
MTRTVLEPQPGVQGPGEPRLCPVSAKLLCVFLVELPRNRQPLSSLGFARDDKGRAVTFSGVRQIGWKERAAQTLKRAYGMTKTFFRLETKCPGQRSGAGIDKGIWRTVVRLVYLATCQLLPFITSES